MLQNVQNFAGIAQMLSKKHAQRFWNILAAYSRVWRSDFDAPRDRNGNSDRYDQYFQQLEGVVPATTCQYIVNS